MTKKILTFLILISLIACEQMDEANVEKTEFDHGVNGKFLASVKPTGQSDVTFWEVEPGTVLIAITESAEERNEGIDITEKIDGDKEITAIYKALADGRINPAFLKSLDEAQARIRTKGTDIDLDAVNPELIRQYKDNSGISERTADFDRSDCAPDLFNDNYGAQWFRDTYGPFTKSLVNQHEVSSVASTKQVRYAGMAADFETGAHFRAYRMNSSLTKWINDVDVPISPRWIKSHIYSSNRKNLFRCDVIGLSPCSRVHFLENVQ